MRAEFTGRILPLLWRRSIPARKPTGRPPRLSVDAVVGAGIRIADTEGLEAASMARVAAGLAVATMTLYTYVPSRADLVDLMVDEVLAGRGLPGPTTGRLAHADPLLRRAHVRDVPGAPLAGQVSRLRPPIGPGMLAESEYVLATVAELGLPTAQVNTAATTVAALVVSAARQEAESLLLRRASGSVGPVVAAARRALGEVVRRRAASGHDGLWNAGGFDRGADEQARDAYDYGLALLLDGIERSVPLGAAGRNPQGRAQSSETTGLRSSPMPWTLTETVSPAVIWLTPAGRAGQDDVAGQQRHHVRDVGHQGRARRRPCPWCGRSGAPPWRRGSRPTSQRISRSLTSRSVTIHGPIGQNESKPFARVHCGSLRCRSRAVTSLPTV